MNPVRLLRWRPRNRRDLGHEIRFVFSVGALTARCRQARCWPVWGGARRTARNACHQRGGRAALRAVPASGVVGGIGRCRSVRQPRYSDNRAARSSRRVQRPLRWALGRSSGGRRVGVERAIPATISHGLPARTRLGGAVRPGRPRHRPRPAAPLAPLVDFRESRFEIRIFGPMRTSTDQRQRQGSANTKTPLPPRGLRSSGMRSAGRIVAQLEPPIDGPARNTTNCLPSTA